MLLWPTIAEASVFMPPQASELAGHVDTLYEFLVWASFISCVLVIGGLIWFSLKYRRKTEDQKSAYISHNATLEFAWSFIPFVIFMVVFGWGWYVYHQMRTFPEDSMEIHVTAAKWNWTFTYKNGRKSVGEVTIPEGKPVKFIISSVDVLHSFYLPSFRVKQDAVPGRYTALWVEATKQGDFNLFCTEYCGKDHSAMLAKVKVLSEEGYEEWLRNNPYEGLTLSQIGEQVFQKNCTSCHHASDQKLIGPGLAGLFGKQRQFTNGEPVVADEEYIRTSILYPARQVVEGYGNLMNSFQGRLSQEELDGVISYIKTLQTN